jgi:ligand-binding sensor domain-containing protein
MKYLVVVLMAAVFGCSDDPAGVDPPPPPPPIDVARVGGLPSQEVHDVFVDSKDRVWVSTEQGVRMKDGSFVRTYTDINGIPNRRCRGIGELNGKIWIGTWGGGIAIGDSMAIYSDTTDWVSLKPKPSGLRDGQVWDIVGDPSRNTIFIGTVVGLQEYVDDDAVPANQRWRNHTAALGAGVQVKSLTLINHPVRGKELWCALTDGGITAVRFPDAVNRSTTFTMDNSGIPEMECNGIAYDSVRDLLWSVFATKGIASLDLDDKVWANYGRTEGFVSDLMSGVGFTAGDSTLWVGSQKGLSKWSPGSGNGIRNYIQGSGLPERRISLVYVDDDARVWLGFFSAGAARVISAQ